MNATILEPPNEDGLAPGTIRAESSETVERNANRRLVSNRAARADFEDQDAGLARLGKDFQNANCMLIAEVKVILESIKNSRMAGQQGRPAPNEILDKTLEYCNRFSQFTNPHTVKNVRSSVDRDKYHLFEIALMANLGIETVDEAKSLIPSLNRDILDDNTIHGTLNDLQNLKKYQASG
ncbi:RNA polymerase B [Gaertneriomyces sp. JEL0708]|nr:RNA polymerase B [Gaertneriomyces sp. JEL0708]